MNDVEGLEGVLLRLAALEDEAAISKLIFSYGLAADAGMASFAGDLWLEDGAYDWDANGEPHRGSAGVEAMLSSDDHHGLIAEGVAHFGGPPLIEIDGDDAVALNYSLIMRREVDRSYLWRVSAVRWDLERVDDVWRVQRRTNRLLDPSGAGSALFGTTLQAMTKGSSS